jgi:hypothetical protein
MDKTDRTELLNEASHINKYVFDLFSIFIITVFFVLFSRIRQYLPVISDSWYHLSVIKAFSEKGLTLHDWWEFAPFGRPHLYSPLFHLINVLILKVTDLGLIDLAKLWGVVTFPCILISGWLAARSLFDRRAALLTLLLISLNVNLFFSFILMPATYAVCLWPFLFILILRKKYIFSAALLSIIFYIHFGIAAVAALSLFIFGLFRREYSKDIALISCLSALACSPWLIHLYLNRSFIHALRQDFSVYIPVFAVLGLACGIFFAARHRDKGALAIVSMILASCVFLVNLPDRFSTYSGFLFPLLGGYGISCLRKKQRVIIVLILAISFVSFTPFIRHSRPIALPMLFKNDSIFEPTPLLALIYCQDPEVAGRFRYRSMPDDIMSLADLIKKNIGKDGIIVTNNGSLGEIFFTLTGRRTTSGLWDEIMTKELKDKIGAYYRSGEGYIIVDKKNIKQVMALKDLHLVAENEDAGIFYRSSP